MYGQAPGPNEGVERRPWRGRAGQTLRSWLGWTRTRSTPRSIAVRSRVAIQGRSSTGKGDRVPTPEEQDLCQFWRDWELRLLRPRLVVPVGTLAIGRLLGKRPLAGTVGERFELPDGAVAIPLPHPSGVSHWLNSPANRALVERAVAAIHEELATL